MVSSLKALTLIAVSLSTLLSSVYAVPVTEDTTNLEALSAVAKTLAPAGFKALPLCKSPRKRRDWRDFTKTQKASYIKAVKCLMSTPSTSKTIAKTRFDDYQLTHQVLGDEIHFTSQFLPWHRLMLIEYERELREKCGYTGGSPYWDWSKDIAISNTTKASPIWDPVTGFGGNGAYVPGYNGEQNNNTNIRGWTHESGGGCIQDGPFKDYTLRIGPGTSNVERCITRSHNDGFKNLMTYEALLKLAPIQNYTQFWLQVEPLRGTGAGPHGAGHVAGGGTVQDTYASPGDPVFYLHHANVDRLWWYWQKQNGFANLYAMDGNAYALPSPIPATLEFVMRMIGVAPDRKIGDVMDIRNTFGCYDYA